MKERTDSIMAELLQNVQIQVLYMFPGVVIGYQVEQSVQED